MSCLKQKVKAMTSPNYEDHMIDPVLMEGLSASAWRRIFWYTGKIVIVQAAKDYTAFLKASSPKAQFQEERPPHIKWNKKLQI